MLRRCISGLPKTECPYIPKVFRSARSIAHNETDYPHGLVKRSPIEYPGDLMAFSRTAVSEPTVECESRQRLGSQILLEKGQHADSMLARFVGNFIMIFSNQTNAQEVSECLEIQFYHRNGLNHSLGYGNC